MSRILSESITNYTNLNEQFVINLEEPPSNHQWELELPSSFQIIKTSYTPIPDSLIRQWIIMPLSQGTYTIKCHYRKLCCGRPIVKTVAFKVIVQ